MYQRLLKHVDTLEDVAAVRGEPVDMTTGELDVSASDTLSLELPRLRPSPRLSL